MFYIVDPGLTDAGGVLAEAFLDAASDVLRLMGTVDVDERNITLIRPGEGDGVVFCDQPEGTPLPTDVERFLQRAVSEGATLLPIALDPSRGMPPAPFVTPQSFSLHDFQQVRSHPTDYVLPAAQAFAREALFMVAPTCFPENPRLFVAHKRSDGDGFARDLGEQLRRGREVVFRDVRSVVVGDDAQARIDEELQRTDAIVFIDTPEVGESDWAMLELRTALERRVPIVWVRFMDEVVDRKHLPVLPAERPHFRLESGALDYGDLAERVVGCAVVLWHGIVASAIDSLRDLEDNAPSRGIEVTALDRRRLIYRVEGRRRPSDVPERPSVDVCQFFGRRPTDDDERELRRWAADEGFVTGDGNSARRIDHAALLDPRPTDRLIDGWVMREHVGVYVDALVGREATRAADLPQLVLAGSFQDAAATHQDAARAVTDIAREWMALGGGIVMGGHPSFVSPVAGAARQIDPIHPDRLLTIYQSRFFVDRDEADLLAHHARVVLTDPQEEADRSLTFMRRRMFEHEGLVGMVAIGGRAGIAGIDEEIQCAQPLGIPIVPLASVGGRTAEICAEIEARPSGWSSFTTSPLSGSELRSLTLRTDHRGIARDLFAKLW